MKNRVWILYILLAVLATCGTTAGYFWNEWRTMILVGSMFFPLFIAGCSLIPSCLALMGMERLRQRKIHNLLVPIITFYGGYVVGVVMKHSWWGLMSIVWLLTGAILGFLAVLVLLLWRKPPTTVHFP